VIGRLPIRARLALLSALVALLLLAAAMATVFAIQREQMRSSLVDEARSAARATLIAQDDSSGQGRGRGRGRGGDDGATTGAAGPPSTGPFMFAKDGDDSGGGGDSGGSRSDGSGGGDDSSGRGSGGSDDSGGGGDSSGSGSGGSDDSGGDDSSGRGSDDRGSGSTGGDDDRSGSTGDDERPGSTGGGDDEVIRAAPVSQIRRYLRERAGASQLLLVTLPNGDVVDNRASARALAALDAPAAGSTREVTLGGESYLLASAAASGVSALAAVPSAEVDEQTRRLLTAMLAVGALGLIPAAAAAWYASRRALEPLSRIAAGASRINAGDLGVRVGPVPTRDEVGQVASAIDGMLERLERAFAAQRRLVHDASHELRTPITIARGHLEVALLGRADASPELRDAAALAVTELDRMSRLVDGLLRLARLEEGDGARERVRVAAVAEDAITRSRPLGDRAFGLDVSDGAAEAEVLGDEGALEQVLLNLLANAVRHTVPGGSVRVAVAAADGQVTMDVADDGEGIPADALPSLFDRFTRADAARTRDRGGAGLGLAICREIVEAHGGTIAVQSEPGQGARFRVTLPAAPASAS
jgi:two-component system OmpR family sensor kinase